MFHSFQRTRETMFTSFFTVVPYNRGAISFSVITIYVLSLTIVTFGVEELNGNDVMSIDKKRDCDGVACSLSSSLKGHLDATDSVLTTLQEMLINAKYKVQDLETHVCDLPVLDARKRNKIGPCPNQRQPLSIPAHCLEIKQRASTSPSGIYHVWPRYLNRSISVYCDMETGTGGWTVFQRRNEYEGNQEDFYRNWTDYKEGFGDLQKEFWLGNEAIFALSNEKESILRVELEDFSGNKRHAVYSIFRVSTEISRYQIQVSDYEGNAGDAMKAHDGRYFSANDSGDNKCARQFKGGWWYADCHSANLNGLYLKGNHTSYADGIEWYEWLGHHYSLKKTEMKMKPKIF